MDGFSKELSSLLETGFRSLLKLEERRIKCGRHNDLSVSEVHLIESVGRGSGGVTVSDIARDLGITRPSVTVGVQKLERKGYVEKRRDPSDGRQVHIALTASGEKISQAHRYFHEQLVRSILHNFPDDEKGALLRGFRRLNLFFHQKLAQLEA